MAKFLIGVATAALWFALSHAVHAERIFNVDMPAGPVVIQR
jgi:hypothetical protein